MCPRQSSRCARAEAPAATTQTVRVLVADHEWGVRAGLRAILDADERTEVVGVAADRDAADPLRRALAPGRRRPRRDAATPSRRSPRRAPARASCSSRRPTRDERGPARAARRRRRARCPESADPGRVIEGVRTVAAGGVFVPPHVALKLLEVAAGGAQHRPDPIMRRRFALLSERELDVVRLLARGCSNAEIAGELYLSEGTVKTYVTRTLNKLRLRSRVQVVVAAYDAGLVKPRERSVTVARSDGYRSRTVERETTRPRSTTSACTRLAAARRRARGR